MYNKTVYSTDKALFHRESMKSLLNGHQPYPVHVEIIISDLCNHDCFFCLDGGTLVLDRNSNHIQIRDIKVGDVVQGPTGDNEVTEISDRVVDEVIEVKVGNQTLLITGNHEVLTRDGWLRADELTVGMPVWMRGEGGQAGEQIHQMASPEYSRGQRKEWCDSQRGTSSQIQAGDAQHSQSSTKEDAIGSKPYEEPQDAQIESGGATQCLSDGGRKSVLGLAERPIVEVQAGGTSSRKSSRFHIKEKDYRTYGIQGQNMDLRGSQSDVLDDSRVRLHDNLYTEELSADSVSGGHDQLLDESRRGGNLEEGIIHGIRRHIGQRKVFNITCLPDHAYFANGIVVHNCAYRMSGYTSNEMFQKEPGQSRKARNPNRKIETKKVYEIIDDCDKMGVKAIQFTGGGEPTVHPDFVPIVAYAQGAGFETSLVTNGNSLHKPDHREVVLQMAWTRISIDAGTAERHSTDRGIPESAFHKICESVELLAQERNMMREQDENYSGPIIGVGFVVNPQSYTEIYQAVEMYSQWGVDNVRLGLMFNPDDETPYEDIREEMKRQADAAVADFTRDDFAVINRTEEKLDDLERKNPEYDFCGFQNFTTYIGGDLNVYRCCVYAYHHHGLIGSLQNQSFKELWDGIPKRDDFEGFDARTCERCQFNDINRSINAALSDPSLIPPEDVDPPLHASFV